MTVGSYKEDLGGYSEKLEEYLFYSVTIIAIIGILVEITSNITASILLLLLSAILVITGLWKIRSEIGPINLLMAFVAVVTWYHGYILAGKH
ncbi:MAG: hypothetical protein F7B59_00280 [Desulfurococcales archaeon]|nr:hypothetical protein [Desulfurococcales archaeon]